MKIVYITGIIGGGIIIGSDQRYCSQKFKANKNKYYLLPCLKLLQAQRLFYY